MSLVVTINGPESIWLLADRRLTYQGHVLRDDARKVMLLVNRDGEAILGYAGLGATAAGTEPADWMSSVLRGPNLLLEQSLGVFADAMKRQLPRHMLGLPGKEGLAHYMLVPAFLDNEARLYSIDIAFEPDRKSYLIHWRIIQKSALAAPGPPPLAFVGSGAHYLDRDKRWIRPLLHMVRAYDRGRISADTLATHLATLNNEVHKGIPDRTVGPRCIVAWRHRKHGVHKGGGGHLSFTGSERDASSPSLPTIVNGMVLSVIVDMSKRLTMKMVEAMREGQPAGEPDKDELNAELARRHKPDEDLR